jgi:hypothetical protein
MGFEGHETGARVREKAQAQIKHPCLQLAREFASAAETYREVRLHGPATDAEARKGACEYLVAARPER